MHYIGMCGCGACGFLWDRVYKSESLSLEQGIVSSKLINWLKILVQSREPGIATQIYLKKSNRQVQMYATQLKIKAIRGLGGGGRFGEFNLVQGSRIQLNQLWYGLSGFLGLSGTSPPKKSRRTPLGINTVQSYAHAMSLLLHHPLETRQKYPYPKQCNKIFVTTY